MIKEIAFTVYPAKDVKTLREWYERHLGLTFSGAYAEEGVEKYNEATIGGSTFGFDGPGVGRARSRQRRKRRV